MNAWLAARRKAIAPAVATIASALEALINGGSTAEDALRTIAAAVVTALVYALTNAPTSDGASGT